jgi:NADPH:quinone reductase
MPHAMQIRQTGGPEVLGWAAVDVGEPGSGQVRIVEAVASNVRGLNVGDRVACACPTGGYSEVRFIEADRLAGLPEAISFDQAAAMMLQGMTAQVTRPILFRYIQRRDALETYAKHP